MRRFRNLVDYTILFVLNGIMLWFFRGYLNLLIAVGMVVFFLYAVISVHIVKRYVSLEMKAPGEYMSKNTEFLMKIRVHNRSVLPLVQGMIVLSAGNTFVGKMEKNLLTVPVKPSGTTEILYPLISAYVGNVEVSVEQIVLQDLLGIHAVRLKLEQTENVYIIPRGIEEGNFLPNDYERGMDEVEESRLSGSDFSDVSQVREYIPGDAMKNIHWKLSAKKDILMVRERLHMSSRKLLVVLSLDKENGKKMDEAVEKLYSFGSWFIGNRVPVTLYWWSERYHEMRNGTAESEEEWLYLMLQLFHNQAGNGFVEEHFKTAHPGKEFILFQNEEVTVAG